MPEIEREIFGGGQRAAGRDDTLDYRVVREVHEHRNTVHNIRVFKRSAEIFGDIVLDAHGGENDCKIVAVGNICLTHYLNGELVMLHAGTREYRELLTSDKRCERVYRRYAGVYINFADKHAKRG